MRKAITAGLLAIILFSLPVSVEAMSVYVLSGGDPTQDSTIEAALESRDHEVTIGVQFVDFDGTINLDDYDVVLFLNSANRDAGDMPVAGQTQLIEYVAMGNGLVTGEWVTWNVTRGNFMYLYDILPGVPDGTKSSTPTITYTAVEPDPILNYGVTSPFTFNVKDYAGTEARLLLRADAVRFYDSDNLDAGLTGWEYEYGRVISFSTPIGTQELENSNYAQLLSNTVEWAGTRFSGLAKQWENLYGGTRSEEGHAVDQTTDGGFILAGWTASYGAGSQDAFLVKTDFQGNDLWSKTFGGTELDRAYDVQETSDGGLIITGFTSSEGAGNGDVWLIKTDSAGNELWSSTFGGALRDEGWSVRETSDGGFIIAGVTSSFSDATDAYIIKTTEDGREEWSKHLGTRYGDSFLSVKQTSDGGYIAAGYSMVGTPPRQDAWLVKFRPNGDEEWSETYGSPAKESATDVVQTPDGGYAFSGWTSAGAYDAVLVKTNSAGTLEWFKRYGGAEGDDATALSLTADGGYVISGTTATYGYYDAWVIKTDDSGNEQWDRTFSTAVSYDTFLSIQQTRDGGYVMTGYTDTQDKMGYQMWAVKLTPNTYYVDWMSQFGDKELMDSFESVIQTAEKDYVAAGYTQASSEDLADFWIVRADSVGGLKWESTFGGPKTDRCFEVAQAADNGFVLVGYTNSFGAGGDDIWVVKTDARGDLVWDKPIGGSDNERAYSVDRTKDGGFIIVGETSSYGAGSYDIWLIKMNSAGEMAWEKTIGTAEREGAYAVRETSDNGFIIAGYRIHNPSNNNAWLVKTDEVGSVVWDREFGGAEWDGIQSVEETPDGGYIAVGSTDTYVTTGLSAAWIIKTNAKGEEQWSTAIEGWAWDYAESVKPTDDGGCIFAGYTYSFSVGEYDLWLVKMNRAGEVEWAQPYGGIAPDRGYSIDLTLDGGFILAGFTTLPTSGNRNGWLIKLTPTPESTEPGELTQIHLATPANESVLTVAPTFTWTADGGTNNGYAVDVAFDAGGPYYSTFENMGLILDEPTWTMDAAVWSLIPSGSYVYWKVRGADMDITPLTPVESDEIWRFYKE